MSYVSGQWNADCDQCGRMFKSGSLRRQWNGLYTCSTCWEPRQPQDFVRAVKDGSPPAFVRGGDFNPTIATIPGTLTASTTSIAVTDSTGFPTTGFPYYASISLGTLIEGVKVTNLVGNTFTVTRGYNSQALAWAANASFSLMQA